MRALPRFWKCTLVGLYCLVYVYRLRGQRSTRDRRNRRIGILAIDRLFDASRAMRELRIASSFCCLARRTSCLAEGHGECGKVPPALKHVNGSSIYKPRVCSAVAFVQIRVRVRLLNNSTSGNPLARVVYVSCGVWARPPSYHAPSSGLYRILFELYSRSKAGFSVCIADVVFPNDLNTDHGYCEDRKANDALRASQCPLKLEVQRWIAT